MFNCDVETVLLSYVRTIIFIANIIHRIDNRHAVYNISNPQKFLHRNNSTYVYHVNPFLITFLRENKDPAKRVISGAYETPAIIRNVSNMNREEIFLGFSGLLEKCGLRNNKRTYPATIVILRFNEQKKMYNVICNKSNDPLNQLTINYKFTREFDVAIFMNKSFRPFHLSSEKATHKITYPSIIIQCTL